MINVIGIGPGEGDFLLPASLHALLASDVVVGSCRQLELVPKEFVGEKMILPKKFQELKDYLQTHTGLMVSLLASGDPMLYGIGNWVSRSFPSDQVQIFSGISSIQYLFSQAQISMNDCYLTSSHGKQPDLDLLASLPKVAMVTDDKLGPYELAQEMLKRGKNKQMIIGENLSYPTEIISFTQANQVLQKEYGMNVVVMLDER
ncbi:cobalt-precorrin-7 (C(5))-methyltransferase [Vagococcus humatus]|uniref:Cobalt-precorrin-7 (C(5))-methyltransferase n=1 Tax=Vagococcus humatus TaxID=1889241 RepID=A0A3S0AZ07_9ENTE|nr:cobalt-precorrin-7 (C(5))-methyltransferase [Vagococcus humatus]RST90322.1 cobalt-precorrin-7 (C(5))-methyltransferase [Vagococcus humatus]